MSGMPVELRDLMERFCQLGRLLPPPADLPLLVEDDPRARAEVEIVLAEMARVRAQIDAFIDAVRRAS
jgi:hypothetical protein